MDVSQYLEIFLDETSEHLQNLNTQILLLDRIMDDVPAAGIHNVQMFTAFGYVHLTCFQHIPLGRSDRAA